MIVRLAPQPGPQTDFLACGADVVLYGGAAGGGKSYGLLLDGLRYCNTPGWAGLILRRHAKDLIGPGSLFEKARGIYGRTGARFREGGQFVDVRWPSGAAMAFRHLDKGNVKDYQGLEYAWIGIDEATHLDISWVLYLITRARTACGTRAVVRMTCNPDPDHPLREWVEPYLHQDGPLDGTADRSKSGMVRYFQVSKHTHKIAFAASRAECAALTGRPEREIKTFAFIPSWISDNKVLLRDNPEYESSLALHGRVTEQQLRDGNWHVRAEVGGMLRRSRWGFVDKPLSPIVRSVRGWDKAATRPNDRNRDPDFTAGPLLQWDVAGRWYVSGLAACRDEPPEVDKLQRSTAAMDGPGVTQAIEIDPGQAGKSDALHTRAVLTGPRCGEVIARRPIADKVTKAQPMARELEQGMDPDWQRTPGGVFVPRGYVITGPWLEEPYQDDGDAPATLGALFWSQVAAFFTEGEHDDIPDSMSIAHAVGTRAVKLGSRPDRAARTRNAYS